MHPFGRIVHFVEDRGEEHPAIVVKEWTPDLVNLGVFADGSNDSFQFNMGEMVSWQTSVGYDANKGPRSWHYFND
ncbi:MAG: hypothetical protein KGL39_16565 [Patescibacteria group bacterium]|nr:hypothetical protein [Patescibacteria group bacterium]